jgi:hypothetical protein
MCNAIFFFSIHFVYLYLDLFIYYQNNSAFGLVCRLSGGEFELGTWPLRPKFIFTLIHLYRDLL